MAFDDDEDADPEDRDNEADYICEYPASCGGLGVVSCDGCGGDLGQCPGCDECPDDDNDEPNDEEDFDNAEEEH